MRVLALDTTTARGSLALLDGREVVAEVRVQAEAGHAPWIHSAVEVALRTAGLKLADLSGLAVALGPGSFTGIRVGIAAAQGLALGGARPCVGFSTLDVLGSLVPSGSGVALLDAWRDEVYAAAYENGRRATRLYGGPLEGLRALVPEAPTFVGDALSRYGDRVRALWPRGEVLEVDLYLAVPLGRLAQEAFARGEAVPPEALSPVYVRGADVRRPG